LGPELSIPDAMFMQHFVHGLGTQFVEYLDMTSGGVFVHCIVEEGKLILDRILSVTPLEDLQLKAPHISEEEPIIISTYCKEPQPHQQESYFNLLQRG
jgi:hypothetical protein